jgi:hypothetical protein
MTPGDVKLDQVMAGIQSMRDVTVHLGAGADAAFSGSQNDEIHRG